MEGLYKTREQHLDDPITAVARRNAITGRHHVVFLDSTSFVYRVRVNMDKQIMVNSSSSQALSDLKQNERGFDPELTLQHPNVG